ncbi:type VII secretion protein EccCb [Streptomyces sp. NPDC059740]|uniref:type VII secretion protein EccCb n=1 Tax=Streptomyces sp. NPDC059740 TaxID=3346926 RepID=UPI00365A5168
MGERRALLVATERYLDESLPALRSPVHDARKLATLLEDPDVGQFDSVQVLVDESKAVIEEAVERLFQDRGVDLALVYLSCHGLKDTRGRLHFATVRTNREMVRASSVSAEFIRESMEYSRARQKIALLDCCFSGAFGRSKGGALPDDIPQQFVDHRGSYVITASNAVQEAVEDEEAAGGAAQWSSVFTRALIQGMSTGRADLDEDGWVTAQELYQYVSDLVARTHEQKPTFFGSDIQGGARLRLAKAAPHAHRPFPHLTDADGPPPRATVDQLLPALTVTGERGLAAGEWRGSGRLVAPVGRSHRVEGRRVVTHCVDLSGGAGHVAVAGGPRSGKTLLLQTLVTSLALTHTPQEVEFHCVDFGGGGLRRLSHLPHVRAVAARHDPQGVRRAVSHAVWLNARRESDFARLPSIDSIEGYRLARARGELADQPVADVFLLVDGWAEFAAAYQDLAQTLTAVGPTSLRHGVHLVLSTSQWSALPPPLLEVMLTRFELALTSPDQSLVHPEPAARLTPATPGVALTGDRAERRYVHVAVPRADGVSAVEDLAEAAAALGRRAAGGWSRAESSEISSDAVPLLESQQFSHLLGIGDAGSFDVAQGWGARSSHERLRVPMGVCQDGRPALLDLKEAAQGGMGPHGLCVGSTGSGKSELLRTLVLALAVTHSPESLNFVLADFKGGATFAGLTRLPHVSGLITNLADDIALIDRMRDALSGELNRRQELLRSAGNYGHVTDYERARAAGAPLEPLPSLLVVVDEFSELLSARPDFIEMFVQMGRIGRSLGVHMLLASQRLEEGRLRGLDTYLSYRIGLRTFSETESRAALGVPDAYRLPHEPGSGLLRHDVDTLVRFKAAYVSEVHRVPGPRQEGPGVPAESVMDVLVRRMAGRGTPARRVWLPPLDASPSLEEVLPALEVSPERGLHAGGGRLGGGLVVPVGLVDRPFEQRREEHWLDLSGAAGHAMVVGGPQSGKSSALRTVVSSLALTHTPAEVQFHALDFGGGGLARLAGLPHVGTVASRLEPEKVRRIVAEVLAVLTDREELFPREGVDSAAAYRRRRGAGEFAEDRWGDVFLVIDGWSSFRETHEDLTDAVQQIAVRGLGFGVHLLLGVSRYSEVRPALRDVVLNRVELRLGDPSDSEIDRRRAAQVPIGSPGRGLSRDGLHFVMARPQRAAGGDAPEGEAERDLVAEVARHWTGPSAPEVRLLPEVLPVGELPEPFQGTGAGVPFAVDEATLSPVVVDFERDPLLVVYGDAGSGKSSLLRLLARQVSRLPAEKALVVVGDYRRALLGSVPEEHLAKYCITAGQLREFAATLAASLSRRLPGPDVTPRQLRERSWYQAPDAFVLVDDYDLVATAGANPLQPLLEYLPFAQDVGLRVVLARRTGGAARAVYEPFLQRVLELGAQTLLLSGDPGEGLLSGHRPQRLPPGRARFVGRDGTARLVQTAWSPPEE